MEFNYLVEKKRMLDSLGREGRTSSYMCAGTECGDCPLSKWKNGQNLSCAKLEFKYPLKATEIVRKWAEEHPRKTRKDVLLEKFPNAVMHFENDYPRTCAECLGLCTHDECQSAESCFECWYTEVEE